MKKILILITVALMLAVSADAQPFYRRTKHKPIKRMKTWEVRKVQSGRNLYERKNGKVYKTGRQWTKVLRPKDNTNYKPFATKKR